jgi:hypothetical protein
MDMRPKFIRLKIRFSGRLLRTRQWKPWYHERRTVINLLRNTLQHGAVETVRRNTTDNTWYQYDTKENKTQNQYGIPNWLASQINACYNEACIERRPLLPSKSLQLLPTPHPTARGERRLSLLDDASRGRGRCAKFYYSALVRQKQSQTIYSFSSNRELTGSLLRTGIMFTTSNDQRTRRRTLVKQWR